MATETATNLRRVIYISSASTLMPPAELEALLAKSRANNTTANLTGLLLYHDGAFFQVLEGEAAAVQAVLDRIRRDRRHAGLITLDSSAISERGFSDWSMGYVPFERLSDGQKDGFRDLTRHAAAGPTAFTENTRLQAQIGTFLSTFREFEAA